jgi:hypothetical protein
MPSLRQISCIGGLFLVLMALAYWFAGVQAHRARLAIDAQLNVVWTAARELKVVPPAAQQPDLTKTNKALTSLQSLGNPWKGTSEHTDVNYWRTINSNAVCLLLLGPAFALFVLRRPGGPGGEWVMFWTVAYLAFVAHLGAGVLGLFGTGTSLGFSTTKASTSAPLRA